MPSPEEPTQEHAATFTPIDLQIGGDPGDSETAPEGGTPMPGEAEAAQSEVQPSREELEAELATLRQKTANLLINIKASELVMPEREADIESIRARMDGNSAEAAQPKVPGKAEVEQRDALQSARARLEAVQAELDGPLSSKQIEEATEAVAVAETRLREWNEKIKAVTSTGDSDVMSRLRKIREREDPDYQAPEKSADPEVKVQVNETDRAAIERDGGKTMQELYQKDLDSARDHLRKKKSELAAARKDNVEEAKARVTAAEGRLADLQRSSAGQTDGVQESDQQSLARAEARLRDARESLKERREQLEQQQARIRELEDSGIDVPSSHEQNPAE